MDASRHARGNGLTDGGHLAKSGGHAEGAFPDGGFPGGAFPGNAFPDGGAAPGGGFQRGGRELDADTGIYPVDDWYAGYEQYAREQDDRPGQPSAAAAGEQPLIRTYARPADPREAPGSAGEWPAASHPPGDHPADGHPADGHPGGLPLAGYPARSPLAGRLALLAGRLARLRADRWVIAGGSLAAAAAVIVAFVMAGGSAAAPGSGTAQTATTHATQPACVTPAPGH